MISLNSPTIVPPTVQATIFHPLPPMFRVPRQGISHPPSTILPLAIRFSELETFELQTFTGSLGPTPTVLLTKPRYCSTRLSTQPYWISLSLTTLYRPLPLLSLPPSLPIYLVLLANWSGLIYTPRYLSYSSAHQLQKYLHPPILR